MINLHEGSYSSQTILYGMILSFTALTYSIVRSEL